MRLRKILLVMVLLYSCGKDGGSPSVQSVSDARDITTTPDLSESIAIPKIEGLRWYPRNIWQESWSHSVVNKVVDVGLDLQEVDPRDLVDLECQGYRHAGRREKSIFWLVVVAAVASQESAFDPHNRYYERSLGEWSEGLMQLSVSDRSRGEVCSQLNSSTIVEPHLNLKCAVLILKDQLAGGHSRMARRIFPPRTYYWSTLTRARTKAQVIAFFKKHLKSLSFCSRV